MICKVIKNAHHDSLFDFYYLNKVSRYEVKKAQNLLNGQPRQALNFQKPYEVFNQLIN